MLLHRCRQLNWPTLPLPVIFHSRLFRISLGKRRVPRRDGQWKSDTGESAVDAGPLYEDGSRTSSIRIGRPSVPLTFGCADVRFAIR